MILGLLTAALFSQPSASETFTARQLYNGCVLVLAGQSASSPATDAASASRAAEAAVCEASIALTLAAHAATDAIGDSEPGRTQSFCPPDRVLNTEDPSPALERAYVAWFEQHPAEQNMADAGAALDRALAETWPCPR